MDQQPVIQTQQKVTRYGTTSLIAGVMQVFFGAGISFVDVAILVVNIIAAFKARRQDEKQKRLAVIGISLSIIMFLLSLFGIQGVAGYIFDFLFSRRGV